MKKTSSDHILDRIIHVGIGLLFISVPLIFLKTVHDSFVVPKLALSQLLIVEIFLLWLLKSVLQKQINIIGSPLYAPLGAFLVIEVLSVIWAQNASLSLSLICQDVSYGLLVFVIVHCLRSQKQIRRTLITAIGTALAVALLGFIQYFDIDLLSLFKGAEYRWGKVIMSSTIGHYNFLAAYLNTIIPPALVMIFVSKGQRRKFFFLAVSFVCIVALLFTQSRGAWLGLTIAVLILCMGLLLPLRWKERIGLKPVVHRIVLGVTVVLLILTMGLQVASQIDVDADGTTLKRWLDDFTASTAQRAVSSFHLSTGSAMYRRIIWIPTLNMIRDNVILGVGKDNFQIRYPQYTPEKYMKTLRILTFRGTKVHNEYLQIFAELGVIGLLMFLWFLYTLGRITLRLLKNIRGKKGNGYSIVLGMLSGIVAIVVHSLVSHPLRLPASSLYFWMFVGLIGSMDRLHSSAGDAKPGWRKSIAVRKSGSGLLVVLIIAVMIVAPVFILRPVLAHYYINKGNVYKENQRYSEAIRFYEKACTLGSRDSEVYRNIGRIYYQTGQFDSAIEYWNKDLGVNPYFPTIYDYLGSAHLQKGAYSTAEAMFLKALDIYPEYDIVRDRLRELYIRWGAMLEENQRFQEAIEVYHRALRSVDDVQFYVRLGYLYYASGLAEEAVEQFEIAVRKDTQCADAYKALGYVYARSSEPLRAVPYYENFIILKPDDPDRRIIEQEIQEIVQVHGQ